jgi:hypothetical protein
MHNARPVLSSVRCHPSLPPRPTRRPAPRANRTQVTARMVADAIAAADRLGALHKEKLWP